VAVVENVVVGEERALVAEALHWQREQQGSAVAEVLC
jgi:hypothetical protein